MLVAGSGCSISLRKMGKDGSLAMTDVEEGEISEAASVEISVGDFNQQEVKTSKKVKQLATVGDCDGGGKGGSNGNSRVWTIRDLMAKYSACRGYSASGLYSFAWAQAVQNKPLNEALGRDVEPSKSTKAGSDRSEDNKIMIDHSGDEKEEGELEEGEIELEFDPAEKLADGFQPKTESSDLHREMEIDDDGIQTQTKEKDLENRVKLIRSVLESTSLVEAHTAFEGVCSRLLWALESLRELVSENDIFPKRDTLVQLSFAALETINSVFRSMSNASKELNNETMSRLLSLVKSHFSPFLSSNQIKKIEAMNQFLSCFDVTPCIGTSNNVRERQLTDGIAQKDYDIMAENFGSALSYVNNLSAASEASKRVASNLRNRAPLLPLLDLHKDHDADSLPSPTREKAPCLPVDRPHSVGRGGPSAGKVGQATDDAKVHPCENEALKSFSTYQQKFGHSSLFKTDSLPSPTPSEESNDDSNGDIGGEVSCSVVPNSVPGSLLISGKNFPLLSNVKASDLPRINTAQSAIQPRYVSTPSVPTNKTSELTVKPSAKSRDPRLRFANPDSTTSAINSHSLCNTSNNPKLEPSGVIMSSRKQKAADESYLDCPTLKRQKNGLESNDGPKEAPKTAGIGGWLEDTNSFEPLSLLAQKTESNPGMAGNRLTSITRSVLPGANVSMSEPAPVTAATNTVSLPSLLKDIVVNPTILFKLLKMGEKPRVTETAHNKPTDPRKAAQLPGSSVSGTVPSVSVSVPRPLANLSKPGGAPQVSSQVVPTDEQGEIHMKPRDPRRVLHANTIQRTGSLLEKQFKVNESPTSGFLDMKVKPLERTEAKPVPSQLVQLQDFSQQITQNRKYVNDLTSKAPDIAPQFTKNLENIANIVAVSQVGNTLAVPQNQIPQSLQAKADRDVEHLASNSGEQQVVVGPTQVIAATSRPQNGWVDVDHLFEGYDDKQKAAIHRERARRLEEQKKMFAARKLCLVLDLDHTLLNSAKFNEVDPVHDEILRKKEEQDREKPCRHLFRFHHMGMWTKLRPGVWNFLEKASKLYELHLYTMGNKLYATEMAKVLDPKGVLFNGRVISRGDDGDPIDGDERVPKSKDLEGVLGMESSVVIIDDSVRVWPHNKMNLIVVERYTYFPCSRRQFGLLGPSLLEIDHDERPEEGTLASSLVVIERIHQNFFSHSSLNEADVRNILASEQRKILAGCRIVFSRVFPVGEANPHLHPLWQTAEQFGAVCTIQINENITHVVANSLGTDKVNWALSKGRFVVHPGWVEASALLYRRANEHDFAIKP